MARADNGFLQRFYQQLIDSPLEPASELYVPLYKTKAASPSDPVSELQATIEWSPVHSAQLFSGFRGTGKSTELRRLKAQLEENGAVVVLCDMQDYLNLTTQIDVGDFLLAIAGAFGDELHKDASLLGHDVIKEGYWTRFWAFLTRTRVDVAGLGLTAGLDVSAGVDQTKLGAKLGGDIKLNLKEDPTFRQKLQERLKGHLGALIKDVHRFLGDCVLALRDKYREPDLRVVLLLDSIEQIRGTSINAHEVASSLETVFMGHAGALKLPDIHVVYTVPPWLKIKAPGVGGLYQGFQLLPCVKVRHRNGKPCQESLDELEHIVSKRGDWRRLLGDDRELLDELLLASGGYLRDLFRILQAVLRMAREGLPATSHARTLALAEVRNSYLPLANDDALWLHRIHTTGSPELDGQERLHDLARFYDTHLVLTYRNGDEWVSIHPLLSTVVIDQVNRIEATRRPEPVPPA